MDEPQKEVLKKFYNRSERLAGNIIDDRNTEVEADFLLKLIQKETLIYDDLDYKLCRRLNIRR